MEVNKSTQVLDLENDEEEKNIEDEDDQLNKSHVLNRFLGISYSLIAASLVAAGDVFLKRADYFNGSEKSLVKYTLHLIPCIIILLIKRKSLLGPRESIRDLCLQGFFFCAMVNTSFCAISFIYPTDLIPLRHINIILVPLFSRLYFNEKLNLTHIIAIILTIFGVFLLCQPSFITKSVTATINMNYTIGISLALASGVFYTFAILYSKKLCNQNVDCITASVYSSYFGVPISAVLVLLIDFTTSFDSVASVRPPIESSSYLYWQVFYMFFGTLFINADLIFFILALRYEDPSKVAIITSTDLVFGFLFQYIILHVLSDWMSLIGAILITIAAVLVPLHTLLENKGSKPTERTSLLARIYFFTF